MGRRQRMLPRSVYWRHVREQARLLRRQAIRKHKNVELVLGSAAIVVALLLSALDVQPWWVVLLEVLVILAVVFVCLMVWSLREAPAVLAEGQAVSIENERRQRERITKVAERTKQAAAAETQKWRARLADVNEEHVRTYKAWSSEKARMIETKRGLENDKARLIQAVLDRNEGAHRMIIAVDNALELLEDMLQDAHYSNAPPDTVAANLRKDLNTWTVNTRNAINAIDQGSADTFGGPHVLPKKMHDKRGPIEPLRRYALNRRQRLLDIKKRMEGMYHREDGPPWV